jgi:hypothetical protein
MGIKREQLELSWLLPRLGASLHTWFAPLHRNEQRPHSRFEAAATSPEGRTVRMLDELFAASFRRQAGRLGEKLGQSPGPLRFTGQRVRASVCMPVVVDGVRSGSKPRVTSEEVADRQLLGDVGLGSLVDLGGEVDRLGEEVAVRWIHADDACVPQWKSAFHRNRPSGEVVKTLSDDPASEIFLAGRVNLSQPALANVQDGPTRADSAEEPSWISPEVGIRVHEDARLAIACQRDAHRFELDYVIEPEVPAPRAKLII